MGCSGECHHIVRRKSAVSDSCLNSLKDVQAKVFYLPLTGDRVSSKSLEDSLEKIKEQKEHITDLTHQNEIFLFRENIFLLMTQPSEPNVLVTKTSFVSFSDEDV